MGRQQWTIVYFIIFFPVCAEEIGIFRVFFGIYFSFFCASAVIYHNKYLHFLCVSCKMTYKFLPVKTGYEGENNHDIQ